jgi:hypothetical protein
MTDALIATVRHATTIEPFVGPDQAALESLLRQFEPATSLAQQMVEHETQARS